jgi:hypothetical protein
MSCAAESLAGDSDSLSSGVMMLRTLSPPPTIPERSLFRSDGCAPAPRLSFIDDYRNIPRYGPSLGSPLTEVRACDRAMSMRGIAGGRASLAYGFNRHGRHTVATNAAAMGALMVVYSLGWPGTLV